VVVTECQAEYITWFLTYASLKYTLESYQDYSQGAPAKDPTCPSVTSATCVTLQMVQKAYPSLFSAALMVYLLPPVVSLIIAVPVASAIAVFFCSLYWIRNE